jgi:hypothetical protein
MQRMLDVSLPCEGCGEAVGFGHRKCVRCGLRLSSAARSALRARLEASSEDYRELQAQILSGRTVLLVASLAYLGFAGFWGPELYKEWPPEEGSLLAVAFVLDVAVGTSLLLCWVVSRVWPATGLLLAAGLWLATQVALLAISVVVGSYFLVFSGLWLKGVVAILMIRGIVAGLRARRLVESLTRRPG